ncbi:hypothetical protein GW17_00061122 [Ensete ventricosum]|nr:hypothetical protein GW17_00061122 [Ensete ventricosum]
MQGLYTDDEVFVAIQRRDRNSAPWSIRTSIQHGNDTSVGAEVCNKFSMLLDLEGCSGDCINEESQSNKCIYGDRTRHKLFSKTEYSTSVNNATTRRAVNSRSECHGIIEAGLPLTGELDCFSAHIRLREPDKSGDKAECKKMDSRAMGLAASWYCRGETSIESSIPCSHGGRAFIVKGAEEVENAKANSKYQGRGKGSGQGTS